MDEAAKERRCADIMFTSNEALRAELMIRDSIISQLKQTIAIKDAAIDDAQFQLAIQAAGGCVDRRGGLGGHDMRGYTSTRVFDGVRQMDDRQSASHRDRLKKAHEARYRARTGRDGFT